MIKFKDITGEDDAPVCPRHSEKIGLVPVKRYRGTRENVGYWQCPQCHHVFTQLS